MKRFWFEFEISSLESLPFGIRTGCGVTAFNEQEAISLIESKIFKSKSMPRIIKIVEDIDISQLDSKHVLLNMSSPANKGIWFPTGY